MMRKADKLFERDSLAPVAWIPLLLIALLRIGTYLLAGTPGEYGIFRDELYYLACANHPAFGYVDQPPLSIFVLIIWRTLFGDSLVSLHILPALVSAGWLTGVGLLARELGGRPAAQVLAAALAFAGPQAWGMHGYYSMNVFDALFWIGACLMVARLLRTGDQRYWLFIGVWLGVGLMNKISLLWFAAGLVISLLPSYRRRWLLRWRPYAAVGLTLILFSPYIIWQVTHDWPTLEFMRNAMRYKFVERSLAGLLGGMILEMNPLTLPLWGGGLLMLVLYRPLKDFRPLAWLFLAVLTILAISGSAKPQYLGPAMPILLAAGAVGFQMLLNKRWRFLLPVLSLIMLLSAYLLLPFAIPVCTETEYIALAQKAGVTPATDEKKELGSLPQHFADRHGWENLARTLSTVYLSLPAGEREQCAILVENYGQAGAVDYYRKNYPLPPVLCGHNNYYLWGPPEETPQVVIVYGIESDDLVDEFAKVETVAEVDNVWSMPYERHRLVRIGRQPYRTIQSIWPELRNFD